MQEPKKVYIRIIATGDDSGPAVQYAYSVEHARELIKTVMPPLKPGYKYVITQ